MRADEQITAAEGWVDPGYLEHELAEAIRSIAATARRQRQARQALGSYPNCSAGDAAQSSIRAALNMELHQYGLRVVRIPNWRGGQWT